MKQVSLSESEPKSQRVSNRRGFLGRLGGTVAAVVGARVMGVSSAQAAVNEASESSGAVPQSVGDASGAITTPPLALKRIGNGQVCPAFPIHQGERAMLDEFTQETFAQQLHTKFQVRALDSAETTEMELVEAINAREHAPEQGRESFSLMFRAPIVTSLEQNTYTFEHEHLGRLDLFVVPIGEDKRGRYYQAVINRLPRA